jgi:hypothetical protein
MQTDFPARINARQVGYARGWRWIVEAFYLVRQQPPWMLLAGGYLLIHFAVAAIPLLGRHSPSFWRRSLPAASCWPHSRPIKAAS